MIEGPVSVRVEVEGVPLVVTQSERFVNVRKVVGRDRRLKKDITVARHFGIEHPEGAAIKLVRTMLTVAALPSLPCQCDYRWGYSDHAEHCRSNYIASCEEGAVDDD